ncbi:MAG: hypothetical protein ACQESR_21395 [Planctomycetota bacterium]
MIVGGYAVAFHGYPRFTKDIDIFFDLSPLNTSRLRQVLLEFGFTQESIPEEALETPGNILAIGVPPVRIGLLNEISGVAFAQAKAHTVRGRYGTVNVTFIGLRDLLRNKRSSSRAKDRADLEELT